jgi:hypothetical protein
MLYHFTSINAGTASVVPAAAGNQLKPDDER